MNNAKTLIEWIDSPVGLLAQELDGELKALVARLNRDRPLEGARGVAPAPKCPGVHFCWSVMTNIPPEHYAGNIHVSVACAHPLFIPWTEVTARVSNPAYDDFTWEIAYYWESTGPDIAMTLVQTLEKVETFLTQIEAGHRGPR